MAGGPGAQASQDGRREVRPRRLGLRDEYRREARASGVACHRSDGGYRGVDLRALLEQFGDAYVLVDEERAAKEPAAYAAFDLQAQVDGLIQQVGPVADDLAGAEAASLSGPGGGSAKEMYWRGAL